MITLQPRHTMPRMGGEAAEQARLVAGLRRAGYFVASIPNGGGRSAAEGANLKVQGLLAGMPDLVVVLPGRTVWIEMKFGNGRLSEAQLGVHEQLRQLDQQVLVAYSAEDAVAGLLDAIADSSAGA